MAILLFNVTKPPQMAEGVTIARGLQQDLSLTTKPSPLQKPRQETACPHSDLISLERSSSRFLFTITGQGMSTRVRIIPCPRVDKRHGGILQSLGSLELLRNCCCRHKPHRALPQARHESVGLQVSDRRETPVYRTHCTGTPGTLSLSCSWLSGRLTSFLQRPAGPRGAPTG